MNKLALSGKSYTFSDYFKLNVDIEDVLAFFGYSFLIKSCDLPRQKNEPTRLAELQERLQEGLPYLSLNNETARREFMIAPLLWEAVRIAHAKLKVEYPLQVNDQLKGTLDYLLLAKNNMLVIEAKNGEMARGFLQLAVELVALDSWVEETSEQPIYGAVSMGDVWKFGLLERKEKRIIQDMSTYGIPNDLDDVMQILLGLLTN